jgi:chemotaxis protein methyltransferase CheR
MECRVISTGEEAYSIAIMLHELTFNDRRNVFILGTDINEEALKKAQLGIYSDWSFRMVEPEIKERYFRKKGSDWELDQAIRSMVHFKKINLVSDLFPDTVSCLYNMDLIVCRNVFIYFSHETIASVVPKFLQTLRNDGYLQDMESCMDRIFAAFSQKASLKLLFIKNQSMTI